MGVHLSKLELLLDRPIFVGFTILDLSKTLMYNFHYNHMKAKYGSRAVLLFTDIDSLTYRVQTEDIYEDMKADADVYDFSDYPKSHPLYSIKNKKVVGKFKDETNGLAPSEFVGLKSKMYSLSCDGKEKKRAKGVSRCVVKRELTHDHYKQCLKKEHVMMSTMKSIRSTNHELYTISLTKKSLSPFDDKRYLLADGVTSLAYGHYKIAGHK